MALKQADHVIQGLRNHASVQRSRIDGLRSGQFARDFGFVGGIALSAVISEQRDFVVAGKVPECPASIILSGSGLLIVAHHPGSPTRDTSERRWNVWASNNRLVEIQKPVVLPDSFNGNFQHAEVHA
jgi:hypothetical protein